MKTLSFQEILNEFPDSLRERILGLEKIDQRRDFHPEGNVLNHTKIVFQKARRFRDINLMLTAIFHDIGKDSTTDDNGSAFGHEDVSADTVMEFKHTIRKLGGDINIIHWLVKNHMRIKVVRSMRPFKVLDLMSHQHAGLLNVFSTQCDTMAEFDEDSAAEFLKKLDE